MQEEFYITASQHSITQGTAPGCHPFLLTVAAEEKPLGFQISPPGDVSQQRYIWSIKIHVRIKNNIEAATVGTLR